MLFSTSFRSTLTSLIICSLLWGPSSVQAQSGGQKKKKTEELVTGELESQDLSIDLDFLDELESDELVKKKKKKRKKRPKRRKSKKVARKKKGTPVRKNQKVAAPTNTQGKELTPQEIEQLFQEAQKELQVRKRPIQSGSGKRKGQILPPQKAKSGTFSSMVSLDHMGTGDFDVGPKEKELLEMAKFVEKKIPDQEWNQVQETTTREKYVVSEGEYLWKISQKLFGTGFYYSKIWSLNPYITNPHEIRPGMTLVFDTGDEMNMPQVAVSGPVADQERSKQLEQVDKDARMLALNSHGGVPNWLEEKKKLLSQGVYVDYATDSTYADLKEVASTGLIKEYQHYQPPKDNFNLRPSVAEYDASGFDRNARVPVQFKQGFHLTTFVSSNLVQDLGYIDSSPDHKSFFSLNDTIYVQFDSKVRVAPGDLYSVYAPRGKISHSHSDRAGFRYLISGEIRVIAKRSEVWECQVTYSTDMLQRNDRITVYTPRVQKILKTFNPRNIEAVILAGLEPLQQLVTFGDVVYLDRGRADGVELGNVFEVYGFKDPQTEYKISNDPAFKRGELVVINMTDNFSTAVILSARREMPLGSFAATKNLANPTRPGAKNPNIAKTRKLLEAKALDELDVELNLDDISEDLLKQADKVELTEDELDELERVEKEKGFLDEAEHDLQELEKIEKEIRSAQAQLDQSRLDEDKYLESQNLNDFEKKSEEGKEDLFQALDEIEADIGKKYMDEDINSKDNPYGLTEFDIEEVDELLNSIPEESSKGQEE